MFLFSKKYKESINKEFIKKVNIKSYQLSKLGVNESVSLSFLNSKEKKDQFHKLKNLLVLELVSLKKGNFIYQLDNTGKKKIYLSLKSSVILNKKFLDYFLFSFLKYYITLMNGLYEYSIDLDLKKKKIEILTCSDILIKKKKSFSDLKLMSFEKHISPKQKIVDINYFSFYKITL